MFKKLLLVLLVLVVLAGVGLFFFGDQVLNKGIQKVVPQLTGTPVKLQEVSLSLFGGSGSITGFEIGNPPGFTTEKAISVAKTELSMVPSSIFGETIQINRIAINAPEIVLERANNTTNLQQIQKNIEAATGGGAPTEPTPDKPASSGPGKKLSIGEFVIENAAVTLSGLGQTRKVTLPTIRLTELGTEEGGVPPAEIASEVMDAIMREVAKQATQLGMQFLQDPQGNIDAAQQQLNRLRDQAKDNLQGAEGAVDALRGMLGGGKKKEDPPATGE